MIGDRAITVDLARLEIVVASVRLPLERTPSAYRCRLDDGSVARSVTFGERSRAVREALVEGDPASALVAILRQVAFEGATSDTLGDLAVLALAGGAEHSAPFDWCGAEVARTRGLSWRLLFEASAIDIDRALCDADGATTPGDVDGAGWTTVVFDQSRADGTALVREMAERLLARGIPAPERRTGRRRIAPFELRTSEGVADPASDTGVTPERRAPRAIRRAPDVEQPSDRHVPSTPALPEQPLPASSSGGAPHAGAAQNRPSPMPITTGRFAAAQSSRPDAPARVRGEAAAAPVGADARAATFTRARATAAVAVPTIAERRLVAGSGAARERWPDTCASPVPFAAEPLLAAHPPASTAAPFSARPAAVTPLTHAAEAHRPDQADRSRVPGAFDWLDAVAQALSDECDRRGLDA